MSKKPRGHIHKIREFELEKINLVDEFDILQIVGEGWFGKILLVEHRASQTEMVLKAVPKPYVSLRDFYREFHYGLHLGIHRNIVTTYDVAFETAGFYVFTQEYAPLGDLTSNVTDTGVGETYSKRVAKQIGAALDYMHSKDIIHRDVKLDNVLIYRSDFTRVKLCDFGESYQAGTLVERRNEWLPYSPPEVLQIKPEGTYKAESSHDVWQFGIVIFVCLTGCLPWQKAASDDPRYMRYTTWHNSMMPIRRTPKLFKLLTSRAQRLFRRFLEPRLDRRPNNLADLTKFLDDRWLAKTAEKEMAEYETDELCPSMYSFHSSPDEKHRLLYTLADCGIETNVDRQSKKNRIKDWIEASVITEEDEEENDDANSASPSSSISREPVAGHISSIRTNPNKSKDIKTTLKDAAQKHFDPRTGALQQGPSEMGVTSPSERKSTSPTISNISTINNGDSMCGSLLTLGSRQDLLESNLQIYNSDLDLHRLGMNLPNYNRAEQQWNQSLSSGNLLLTNETNKTSFYMQQASGPGPGPGPVPDYGIGPGSASANFQRSYLDTVKATLYASSPAVDTITNVSEESHTNFRTINGGYAPNSSGFFITNGHGSALKTNNADSSSAFRTKSVTFTGLNGAFQMLAQMPLQANANATASNTASHIATANAVKQQTQLHQDEQLYNNSIYVNQYMYSQVKDSAYGSTEVNDTSNKTQMNGNATKSARDPTPIRQQLPYRGAQTTSSMKDTAYDHVTVRSNTKKRR